MSSSILKKSKIIRLITALILTLGGFLSAGITASASSVNETNDNDVSDISNSTFDSYVQVENNRYILNIPSGVSVNSNEVEQVKNSIEYANKQIEANNGMIDPITKVTTYKGSSRVGRAAGSYTYTNFWWGTRYYFRSNNAVYKMDHDLDNYSLIGGVSALFAPAIGGLGVLYMRKVKSDLDYYNKTHLHDYINMDVTWVGVYKIYKV